MEHYCDLSIIVTELFNTLKAISNKYFFYKHLTTEI